jgi:hypothetical protein
LNVICRGESHVLSDVVVKTAYVSFTGAALLFVFTLFVHEPLCAEPSAHRPGLEQYVLEIAR